MNSFDLLRMGFRNLWRRKLRTFLTILGVVVGTASIVVMLSLGFGMDESFKNELSRMGSLTVIDVRPGFSDIYMGRGMVSTRIRNTGSNIDNTITLDDSAVASFASIKGVIAVTPLLEDYIKMVSGRYVAHVSIVGIKPDTMEAFDFKVKEGRLLEEGDAFNLVFGSQIPYMFYNEKARFSYYHGPPAGPNVDVLNDRLVMTYDMSYGSRTPAGSPGQNNKPPKIYRINGVGLLTEGDWEKDYYVFMPLDQMKKIQEEKNKSQARPGTPPQQSQGYNRVKVKVNDMKDVQRVQEEIKAMGFNAHSLTEYLDSMKQQSANIRALLGGIGAISLFVAALGITNTMVMSIYERTKEIGIMKVIGASFSDIRRLFLFEAGMIGFAGGVIGIGLSFLISYMLNSAGFRLINMYGPGGYGNKISLIPLWLVPFSVTFSTLVGIISGLYPAIRAMGLSALDAIRSE